MAPNDDARYVATCSLRMFVQAWGEARAFALGTGWSRGVYYGIIPEELRFAAAAQRLELAEACWDQRRWAMGEIRRSYGAFVEVIR